MSNNTLLTNEQKAVILTSRLTFSEQKKNELCELAKNKLDWFEIFRIAIKNKVLGLLWNNLVIHDLDKSVPKRLSQVAHFYLLGTRERNKVFFSEMEQVINMAKSKGVICIPLKGAYLIPNIYKDYGIRTIGDIDFMIKKGDTNKLIEIMQSIGYVQGEYNSKTNSFDPLRREKQIVWKTKMSNLYPFKKISNSDYVKYTLFDFCFSLDLDLDTSSVEMMISKSEEDLKAGYYSLKNNDFFIHLCCHLYKEAVNAVHVVRSSDLNLIKFCDVREFIIQNMDSTQLNEALKFAKDNGLEKAVYYTLYYLNEIYCDGYETALLEKLEVENKDFIHEYGEKNYGQVYTWKKSFWERLFADTNEDELVSNPKYLDM